MDHVLKFMGKRIDHGICTAVQQGCVEKKQLHAVGGLANAGIRAVLRGEVSVICLTDERCEDHMELRVIVDARISFLPEGFPEHGQRLRIEAVKPVSYFFGNKDLFPCVKPENDVIGDLKNAGCTDVHNAGGDVQHIEIPFHADRPDRCRGKVGKRRCGQVAAGQRDFNTVVRPGIALSLCRQTDQKENQEKKREDLHHLLTADHCSAAAAIPVLNHR